MRSSGPAAFISFPPFAQTAQIVSFSSSQRWLRGHFYALHTTVSTTVLRARRKPYVRLLRRGVRERKEEGRRSGWKPGDNGSTNRHRMFRRLQNKSSYTGQQPESSLPTHTVSVADLFRALPASCCGPWQVLSDVGEILDPPPITKFGGTNRPASTKSLPHPSLLFLSHSLTHASSRQDSCERPRSTRRQKIYIARPFHSTGDLRLTTALASFFVLG